jgi:uncharacterized protein YukE
MRSEAYSLQAKAEALTSLAQRLAAHAEALEFEGPAARRYRGAMVDRQHRVLGLAQELLELSASFLQAAGAAEEQLAELERQEQLRQRGFGAG